MKYTSNSRVKKIIFFDYDGVLVRPGEVAVDSLKYAAHEIAPVQHRQDPNFSRTIKRVLQDATGTTERNLVSALMREFDLPLSNKEEYAHTFYTARTTYLKGITKPYSQDVINHSALYLIRYLHYRPDHKSKL